MPSPPRSESKPAQSFNEDSFVAFEHAAAGHDGVRSDPSGSIIAKPCIADEVAFYESSVHHPAFRAYMPTFIGTLASSGERQISLSDETTISGNLAVPSSTTSSSQSTNPSPTPDTPHTGAVPLPPQDEPWVPSEGHGRKLDTGISIVLENVAAGFQRPNILDVKLGARLWGDDSPLAKRERLDAVSKETTSGSLGFRIAGMKVWTGLNVEDTAVKEVTVVESADPDAKKGTVVEEGGYRRYDKWYGRAFNEHNVREGFKEYLAGAKTGNKDNSKVVAKRLLEELRRVRDVLESEESRMYSASILIVYEGDQDAFERALEQEGSSKNNKMDGDTDEEDEEDFGFEMQEVGHIRDLQGIRINGQMPVHDNLELDDPETANIIDDDEEEDPPKVHDLRLIDFAHARWTPGEGPDENVLHGVRNLIRVMDELTEQ